MNQLLRQLQHLVARLSPREQRLIAVFGSLVVVALAWSLILAPILDGRDGMRREIDGLAGELAELDSLAHRIREVARDAPKGASKKVVAEADFSLLGFVEKAAAATLRPESIASMSPSRRPLEGGRQENSVELKLSAVALDEVVALLRAVEGEKSPVYVRQFTIKKRYDDPSQFDLTLVTAASLPG